MCFTIKDLHISAEALSSTGDKDYKNGNTDVIVLLEESSEHGEKTIARYIASFFTYQNIIELKSIHKKTGEYLNGKYFYTKNMLLIDDWSLESIRSVIEHLYEEGDFREVFRKI